MSDLEEKTSLDVRAMRSEDLPRVCELASQLGYPASLDSMRARFARVFERPEQGLFVATREAHVAGWLHAAAAYPLESEPYVEIVSLVVAAEDRRCGVGRVLVERARRWARDLGYRRLRVRSNVERREAHEFYPGLGFQLVKTQHTYERDA